MFGFLGGAKTWAYMALGAGLIFVALKGIILVGDVMDAVEKSVRQEAQLEIRAATISALETEKALIEKALAIAEEERKALELINNDLRDIRNRASAAGDDEDGEIAPVLGDTLRALSE